MTRYILGGGRELYTGDSKKFCKSITKGFQNPLILDCFFAEPPQTWPEKFNRKAKEFFAKNIGGEFKCELADPKKFARQVQQADIIYLHGGDSEILAKLLKPFDLPKLWEEKTVVGTSAGAMYLGKWAWGCDRRQVSEGSGILNVGVVVHYRSDYGSDSPQGPIDWEKADAEIASACPGLPVYKLKEGEFVVLEA